VGRSETAPKGKSIAANPLAWKGQLFYPLFGDPSASPVRNLSFALPMVVDTRGPAPGAVLRLLARNQLLAESALTLARWTGMAGSSRWATSHRVAPSRELRPAGDGFGRRSAGDPLRGIFCD
jgi:hypothetical protein